MMVIEYDDTLGNKIILSKVPKGLVEENRLVLVKQLKMIVGYLSAS
jgi:hypothetical protein